MRLSARSAFLALVFLATTLALSATPRAQSYKLAGPFQAPSGGGDVQELRASPDGTRVAYRADEETYGVFELFVAPVDASAPAVKLSGAMVTGGDVAPGAFAFSPDGAWLVYVADPLTDGVDELFAVPSDGSAAPVKLSGTLTAGGDVVPGTPARAFAVSADSQRVVYVADATVDGHLDLWSAPIDGSTAPVELDGSVFTLVGTSFRLGGGRVVFAGASVADGTELLSAPIDGSSAPSVLTQLAPPSIPLFELTADGATVAFVSAQTSPSIDQRLWSVPADGSASAVLLTPAVHSQIQSLRLGADGSRAVYRATLSTPTIFELFSVPLDGSASPVRLHAPFAAGRNVVADQYGLTADSARAVYVADVAADELYELWSAPLDGSASAIKISGTLAPGADVVSVSGAPLVTASERLVFHVGSDLYSAPADGSGAALKLNGSLSAVTWIDWALDPHEAPQPLGTDHSRVVFARLTAWSNLEEYVMQLYSVPVDGSAAPVRLNGTLHATGGVGRWDIAGNRVVFSSDESRDDMYELYSAPLDGSSSGLVLNGPMALNSPESFVELRALTLDGSHAVYTLRFDGEGETEDALYSVPTDASASPVELQPSVGQLRMIYSLAVSPDGTRVVYQVIGTGPGPAGGSSLRTAPLDGSVPSAAFSSQANSGFFRITPDSADVITLGSSNRFFRSPIDASASGVPLTTPLGQLYGITFSPDGNTILFEAELDVPGVRELYRVPADGSGLPQKLNPPLVTNGDVGDTFTATHIVLVSPDGTRVVYLADQDVDEIYELYSVPLAGGAATKLSGPMVAAGDVTHASISPDGARVVYRADQDSDQRYEVYSVPLTGGPVTKLNGALVTDGDVASFLIGPDGQRVVYFADQGTDGVDELYSVPIAGGPAVRLNGNLVAGGDVESARISPDGTRVVYRADQVVDERLELYGRAIDGSGVVRRLALTPPAGGDVQAFEITADSRRVVYSGDCVVDERTELFKVPIAGGPSVRLNATLVAGGDVAHFLLDPDGQRVVYVADQETDRMFELYAVSLQGNDSGPHAAPR